MERNPTDYRDRTIYRSRTIKNHLIGFNVTVRETDLFISADSNLTSIALASVHRLRTSLESYITAHREFLTSLKPVVYDEWAPGIVRDMMRASVKAGVGPMAAVAGAMAEHVGRDLLLHTRNVIIENGGDIYLKSMNDVSVGLFAGRSPLSGRVSIKVRKEEMPLGVCTSSGTVGHSLSFGCTDACCVKSASVALADAAATAIGNIVKSKKDLQNGLKTGMKIEGVLGIVIIIGDRLGVIGDIELVKE
jgi:ApbE superfamily uncharacterized protein (UPF0280 family)